MPHIWEKHEFQERDYDLVDWTCVKCGYIVRQMVEEMLMPSPSFVVHVWVGGGMTCEEYAAYQVSEQ